MIKGHLWKSDARTRRTPKASRNGATPIGIRAKRVRSAMRPRIALFRGSLKLQAMSERKTARYRFDVYLLPGLTAGILARSGGRLSAGKFSTFISAKLTNGQ